MDRPPWETEGPLTEAPKRPPRVLLTLSAFKGTLSAREACDAAADGLRVSVPRIEIISVPVADGGGGTARALVEALGGAFQPTRVVGPLGDEIDSEWAALSNNAGAVEMAAASGLALVPSEKRNPLDTTSYGTGQLVRATIEEGAKRVLLGVGDSATVDGGLGATQALGAVFRRADGSTIDAPITGRMLAEVASVDLDPLRKFLAGKPVEVLCDVDNPLVGERGAARVFGPQKGADEAAVAFLEEQLDRVYSIIEEATGKKVRDLKGAGAAGGMGAAVAGMWGGAIVSGSERLLTLLGVNRWIGECDLVVVGEGQMNEQSLSGKASGRIAQRARARSVPVAALVGSLGDEFPMGDDYGIQLVTALRNDGKTPSRDEALADMRRAAERMGTEAVKRYKWS